MINTLRMIFKIDISYATNSFIYTIKKLPILKNVIPDNLYGSSKLKGFVRILSIFLTSFRLFLYRILYFWVVYYISSFISKDYNTFLYVYFIFALIGIIINVNLLSVTKKKYFSILLFQMDAKEYMKTDFVFGNFISFFLNLIGFLVIGKFIEIPPFIVLSLCLFSFFSRTVGEAISISFYKKKGYLLTSNYTFTYGYILILLTALSFPYLGFSMTNELFYVFFIIMGVLAIVSYFYIMSINDYKLIYKKINTARVIMNEKNVEAYKRQAMVEIKDKDMDINHFKIIGKRGYDLFNTIFFERHREILLRSAKTFSLIILGVIIVLIVAMPKVENLREMIHNLLLYRLGFLVIFMYFINRGAIVTQAMFYNCDHAMLTYNFYREPKVLLNLFWKRLITTVKVNLLPAVVFSIGVVFLLYFSGGASLIQYITIPLFIILLSIFFSVHYLVIYYLLQPFNKDLEMKKASYSIVSFLTYFISYILTNVHISSLLFSIIGLIFTVLYIVIALFLVYKEAPKTFKINN